MRAITPTLSICALAAAFTAGALTAAPDRSPAAATTPSAAESVLTISSFAFAATTVAPGTTVRVRNVDPEAHSVTADDGSFDAFVESGKEVTFVAPSVAGSYTFFCSVHPSMAGTFTVT